MILTDAGRNHNLTDFGKATLSHRYMLEGEKFQDAFARVAKAYGDSDAHAQRIYDYISKLWFMPATPVLTNGGAGRGLPISCFLNEAEDSLGGIINLWVENCWLAAKGGGIGSYWGNLRSIGERVHNSGKTGGVIPFIKVQDILTLAISQGSIRRGSAAVYMPVWHPEIEEFIEIRRPTGGDPNRRCSNIHNAVVIDDKFMQAVESGSRYDLLSPKDDQPVESVDARELWTRILTARIETGEPYILFSDTTNRQIPDHHKRLGLKVKMSNLCSEITLPTGVDHLGNDRTAVCCLSSLNLEKYDEWKDDKQFIEDVMRFLDNVLQDFINRAPDEMIKAKYAAHRERSVGLGVMGFHSYLQKRMIPFESAMAKSWNLRIFKQIDLEVNRASRKLAQERGPCPDAEEAGVMERFSNKTAIAPTASISIICGGASPGIEPVAANSFTHKTLTGSFTVRNKYLDKIIMDKLDKKYISLAGPGIEIRGVPQWVAEHRALWSEISQSQGSIQHIDFFTEDEKSVFKTAQEMDQRWVIEHAADRTPFISQSQSVNIFLPPDVHKRYLSDLHYLAWKRGLKSLYYLRSTSSQRAERALPMEDCLACQ